MNHRSHLAIIGSGASSIYLLKHLLDAVGTLRGRLTEISIFERRGITGMGMPYSPQTTDRYNMSNISSEELPELPATFGDWLRAQDRSRLEALGVGAEVISDGEVYSRLALGQYLQEQYRTLLAGLESAGIVMHEHASCEVVDIQDHPEARKVTVITSRGVSHDFDRIVIATGHCWAGEDRLESGFYASPWPIFKLLPEDGALHNFAIGTLGASLSAFDVIASLAHRHGKFVMEAGRLSYRPHPGTEEFKIVMHSSQGLLPHLQFAQVEPFREIYRHVGREELLSLVDEGGFLRIDTYFDQVCRPALILAFQKDNVPKMVERLADPGFGLRDFTRVMTDQHDYPDAFEGMRSEMVEARASVLEDRPIHWKEVLDDLMYTLNFHAELLPAEDHLLLQTTVMPFLMNVIAAMPLPSGDTILALRDAGKLDIQSGKVSIEEKAEKEGMTTITVDDEGKVSTVNYGMFIDCSGQKALELEDYPFPALVKAGLARRARAAFASPDAAASCVPEVKKEHLFRDRAALFYHTGGVDIDATYRLIGSDGNANPRIHDIAFPHTSGVRPYSYGLQACSHTSGIVVQSWVEEAEIAAPVDGSLESVTEIYEKVSLGEGTIQHGP